VIGEEFHVFSSVQEAEEFAEQAQEIQEEGAESVKADVEQAADVFYLLLKADVGGSLEVLEEMIRDIPQDRIRVVIVRSEVGNISEDDVRLAQGTKAHVIGFRVKPSGTVASLAEHVGVEIDTFDVIYEVVDRLKTYLEKAAEPQVVRTDHGTLQILAIFNKVKGNQVVGGRVIEGEIRTAVVVEVVRGEEVIGQGRVINLQHNRENVAVVQKGQECGVVVDVKAQLEERDRLVSYTEEKQKLKL
jgi:translation initiation factor IF-2